MSDLTLRVKMPAMRFEFEAHGPYGAVCNSYRKAVAMLLVALRGRPEDFIDGSGI